MADSQTKISEGDFISAPQLALDVTPAAAPSAAPSAAVAKSGGAATLRALVATLRHIAMPVLLALAEVRAAQAQKNEGDAAAADKSNAAAEAALFQQLIGAAVALARSASAEMGAEEAEEADWARWQVAASAAQLVAVHYKATAQVLSAEAAGQLVAAVNTARLSFRGPIAESVPADNSVGSFRARMLDALVPVVGAVAQYAFSRTEHQLLSEVTARLLKTADQATRALAPAGMEPKDWRLLSWHVLKSAGQLYAEAHYTEADRLLYMPAEERKAYFTAHNNLPPLDKLWHNFDRRMAMLVTLAAYIDIPETARLDAAKWE